MVNYVYVDLLFIFIINSIFVIEGVVIVTREYYVLFAFYIYFTITSGLLRVLPEGLIVFHEDGTETATIYSNDNFICKQ